LVGQWTVHKNQSNGNDVDVDVTEIVDRDAQYWKTKDDNDKKTTTLSLPGNVIVQYDSPLSTLEISFVVNDEATLGKTIRVSMKREFHYCAESEIYVISDAEYCWEEKN